MIEVFVCLFIITFLVQWATSEAVALFHLKTFKKINEDLDTFTVSFMSFIDMGFLRSEELSLSIHYNPTVNSFTVLSYDADSRVRSDYITSSSIHSGAYITYFFYIRPLRKKIRAKCKPVMEKTK